MSKAHKQSTVAKADIEKALNKLAEYKLHHRLQENDGNEAHRTLPIIWPVIREICLIADAAESGMVVAKSKNNFFTKVCRFFTFKQQTKKHLTESSVRS